MSDSQNVVLNAPDVANELKLRFLAGRYDALREVQRYCETEAQNAFMAFSAATDTRAFELRSLAANFGRRADEVDAQMEPLREERRNIRKQINAT